jgi:hypothetical protein
VNQCLVNGKLSFPFLFSSAFPLLLCCCNTAVLHPAPFFFSLPHRHAQGLLIDPFRPQHIRSVESVEDRLAYVG